MTDRENTLARALRGAIDHLVMILENTPDHEPFRDDIKARLANEVKDMEAALKDAKPPAALRAYAGGEAVALKIARECAAICECSGSGEDFELCASCQPFLEATGVHPVAYIENRKAAAPPPEHEEVGVWASPGRHSGDPCVLGTRVPTRLIAQAEEIRPGLAQESYPHLTPEQIEVALWYERIHAVLPPSGGDPCVHERTERRNTSGPEPDTLWCADCGAITTMDDRDPWTLPATPPPSDGRPAGWRVVCMDGRTHSEHREQCQAEAARFALGANAPGCGPHFICPSVDSLDAVLRDTVAWGCRQFPDATAASCAAHLATQAEELKEKPTDPHELADIVMLAAHGAHHAGVDLVQAIREKLAINRARQWGEKNAEGFVEHVREEDDG